MCPIGRQSLQVILKGSSRILDGPDVHREDLKCLNDFLKHPKQVLHYLRQGQAFKDGIKCFS